MLMFLLCSSDNLYEEIRAVGVSYILYIDRMICVYHAESSAVSDTKCALVVFVTDPLCDIR